MLGPNVKVFTAGDHFSGHDKPGESKGLLETLLNRVGYTKTHDWECRVDKMKHCSGESRPIRVVGFKNYGVVLRVKPTVHATIDYQMTLLIPQGSGYSAKSLFEQLKANEKSFSRVIRQQERLTPKENEMSNSIHPAPSPFPKPLVENSTVITEYRPEFKNLQAILKNNDKLKYVLGKIQAVNDLDFCRNKVQFVETVKHECGWDKEGHAKTAVGRLLTELIKSDYLMETINERDKIIGYTLTEKAQLFIIDHEDDKPLTPPAPKKKEEVKIDIPAILINMREKLQELADVANKFNANNIQKAEMFKKIAQLDKENEELSKVLCQSAECQEVLGKLGQFITPLPMQGV